MLRSLPTGNPPTPVALWPCASQLPSRHDPTGAVVITRPLAERLLATYTRPGDLVIHTTPAHQDTALRQAAHALKRRLMAMHPIGAAISRHAQHAARLLVTTSTPAPGRLIDPPSVPLLRAARWLLTPGGLLAVVLDRPHHPAITGQDAVSVTVGRAAHAGLGYLQHVIALQVPVRDGQLLPAHTSTTARPADRARSVPAHTDVLVFTAPPMTGPVTEPLAVTGVAGD